jgi:hypothetical protein
MPTARSHLAVGVINGVIYAVGGFDGASNLATLEAYNPATDTWTMKTPMPTGRHSPAAGVISGILYVVGGQDTNGNWTATLEAYDPATDTWTTKAPMPTARGHVAGGVADGLFYAVGGIVTVPSVTILASLEVYDPVTNTWATKASMSTPRWHLGVGVANGRLYALGGASCNGDCPLSVAEVYTPSNDSWGALPPMPTARGWLAVGVENEVLYAIGGSTCNLFTPCPLATNESFTQQIEVDIDIKPGSSPNSINLVSAGSIPVALLSTTRFDATAQVDPDSLRLAGATVNLIGKSQKFQCSSMDVNADGLRDLVCHFDTAQFMIEPGESIAVLEGKTFDGRPIRGEDSVRIVPD